MSVVDENKLEYLQRPVPEEDSTGGKYTTNLCSARGLSRQKLIDSLYLEDCLNVDVDKLPVIMPMKVYGETADVELMWKENEDGIASLQETTDDETNIGEIPIESDGLPLGRVPIGKYPTMISCGKYIVVGSYLSPHDLLSNDGWENWNNYATRNWWPDGESGETREVDVTMVSEGAYFTVGGASVYVPESGSEGSGFDEWYCLCFIDTEIRRAYIALPPVSGNDFEIGSSGGRGGNDGGHITYVRMKDYLRSPSEMYRGEGNMIIGEKKLCAFQLYSQEEVYDLGEYETVILSANAAYDSYWYSKLKKNAMGEPDDEDDSSYYGTAYRGGKADGVLADCSRCLFTPFVGDSDKFEHIRELSLLYHMTSTVLPSDIEEKSCKGFLSEVYKPFGLWYPSNSSDRVDGQRNLGDIEKVESVTKFVAGAVPVSAASVANSRLYSFWKSGVYVSGFNNYDDFSMKFGEETNASDPWSSLSAGNADTIGDFVAAAPYGNRVVCFKDNCSMEVRGTNSPFTLVSSSDVGAVSGEAVCSDGGYLLFVSRDNIYMYTGSEPEPVADALCLKNVEEAAVVARDGYMYAAVTTLDEPTEEGLTSYTVQGYVMSMDNGYWGRLDLPLEGLQFSNAKDGVYCLADSGEIADSEDYRLYRLGVKWPENWLFETKYISGSTFLSLKLSDLNMIFDMEKGSFLKISIRYYEGEEYTVIWQKKAERKIEKQKLRYNFNGKMCGGYQVKVEGGGYSCIYALEVNQRAVNVK